MLGSQLNTATEYIFLSSGVKKEDEKTCRKTAEIRISVEASFIESILVYFSDGRSCVHKRCGFEPLCPEGCR